MADYTYSRELIQGVGYNINHPQRVDEADNQIYLAKEIEEQLPGKVFIVSCFSHECIVSFEEELTSEEESILAAVVQAHKDNV